MNIFELEKKEDWKKFLDSNNHLIFHTPEWKEFIESSFDIKMKYFAGQDNGVVEFLFPVGVINSVIFGKRLISVPFLEYGGFAGKIKYLGGFVEYIRNNYSNYDYLQIREGIPEKFMTGFEKVGVAKRFILRLGDIEKIWEGLDKQKRKAIRKAETDVSVKDVTLGEVSRVYQLYFDSMKKFGSPNYGISYFENFFKLVENGKGKCLGAYVDDKLVGFLMGFCYRDKVHIVINASDADFLSHRPNDLLHWEFIKWANDKYRIFDFGITRENSGPYTFKEKWGGEVKDLNNYYLFLKKNKVSDLSPGKFKTLEKIWGKLPDFVSEKFGPKLREGLGI